MIHQPAIMLNSTILTEIAMYKMLALGAVVTVGAAGLAPFASSSATGQTVTQEDVFEQSRRCKKGFVYSSRSKKCVRRKRGSYRGSKKS